MTKINKEGWEIKKLGEVGSIVTGSTPSTKEERNYNSNDFPFVKPSDLPTDGIAMIKTSEFYISEFAFSGCRQLPSGSVLISCIGSIGKIGIMEVEATCNQQINAIIPDKIVDSKCLAYILLSRRYELQQIANAPVVPIINKRTFSSIQIPLPPLPIQQRIVEELDEINAIISAKKQQLSKLDELAQSIFYNMFGDPVANEKGWEVKTLSEISQNCDYARKPITSSDRIPGKIPYYGASGIVDYVKDYIFDDDYLCVSEDGANLQARSMPIAFSITGKTWVNNHAHVLKFEKWCTQLYVQTLINLRDISEYITGAVQPKLNQAKLNIFPIPLPPLPLQETFAARVAAIEEEKAFIAASIEKMQTLLDARMQEYFG